MRYRTIVADPPWEYERTGVTFHDSDSGEFTGTGLPYETMTLGQIAALPVYDLSDNVDHDAHLYLWTTSRYLPDSFSIAKAWGFHYAATLIWCKPSRGWSTGGRFQNNVEFVLFCHRPKLTTREDCLRVSSWLYERAREAGVSEDDINEHMGTRRMAMWWISRNPRMSAVPRWEQWERLRSLIGFGSEMDDEVRRLNAAKGTKRQETKQAVMGRWFTWGRGQHSAKPEAFFDLVESVSPGPYLELFARRQRLGWDTWGNEALEHVELVSGI